ncbi:hypothetical protein E2542_SST28953 [Spatholobus suberectus]|nr:hypothetical protein E2542_SST28953 [Spatholobus suberectus]
MNATVRNNRSRSSNRGEWSPTEEGTTNNVRGGSNNVGLSASARPPLQHVSGVKAVFLVRKRESTGTGVFLPHYVNTQAFNTVLVPNRVAHVLKNVVVAVRCLVPCVVKENRAQPKFGVRFRSLLRLCF